MTAIDLFAVLRQQGADRLHTLSVERITGNGAYGKSYDDPEDIEGFYLDGTKTIGAPDAQQIVVSGQFAFSLSYNYVPVDSRVTLPSLFGARVTFVNLSAVGDGAGLPTPDHQMIGLL